MPHILILSFHVTGNIKACINCQSLLLFFFVICNFFYSTSNNKEANLHAGSPIMFCYYMTRGKLAFAVMPLMHKVVRSNLQDFLPSKWRKTCTCSSYKPILLFFSLFFFFFPFFTSWSGHGSGLWRWFFSCIEPDRTTPKVHEHEIHNGALGKFEVGFEHTTWEANPHLMPATAKLLPKLMNSHLMDTKE